jgi:transposase
LRKRTDQLKPHELAERERWFDLKPELRLAHLVVVSCLEIWHSSSSSKTARERYRRWLLKFPLELREDFKELLTAFRNWEEYIFNYFDHRYTNAFTESSNRLVKDIQRETRSCEFKTLRARVIYGTMLQRQMKEARREEMKRKIRKPQMQGAVKPRRRRRHAVEAEVESKGIVNAVAGDSQLPALQMGLF